MSKSNDTSTPRERIVAIASQLFYRQGYRATGINEVIKQSGVAKATFYNHFPAKDDLCLAYLEERSMGEQRAIAAELQGKRSPRSRFMAVIESMQPWLEANDMRGCEFLNTVAEVPDPENPLRRRGRQHYEWLRGLIRELAEALIESDTERYGTLDADVLTDDYMVVLAGSIALAELYHDTWPIRHGIKMVRRMID